MPFKNLEMNSEEAFSQLQEQLAASRKREIACCEQINQLTHENLELIQQAAQAKAYKKQIDILLSDPMLVKMRTSKDSENGIEIESDSQILEELRLIKQKLKEVSKERDEYAQIASEKSFFEEQIDKKNKQIIELTEKLSTSQSNAEIYKSQLDSQNEYEQASLTEDEKTRKRMQDLERENQELKELLKTRSNEVGSLKALNAELDMKNKELKKQFDEAQTMITLQQTENRMQSDPLFDKEDIAKRIRQACERTFKNADEQLDKMVKRIDAIETKVEKIKSHSGGGEADEEQLELIESLREQIRDFEENDAAPELAAAMKQIQDLKRENEWYKNKM